MRKQPTRASRGPHSLTHQRTSDRWWRRHYNSPRGCSSTQVFSVLSLTIARSPTACETVGGLLACLVQKPTPSSARARAWLACLHPPTPHFTLPANPTLLHLLEPADLRLLLLPFFLLPHCLHLPTARHNRLKRPRARTQWTCSPHTTRKSRLVRACPLFDRISDTQQTRPSNSRPSLIVSPQQLSLPHQAPLQCSADSRRAQGLSDFPAREESAHVRLDFTTDRSTFVALSGEETWECGLRHKDL